MGLDVQSTEVLNLSPPPSDKTTGRPYCQSAKQNLSDYISYKTSLSIYCRIFLKKKSFTTQVSFHTFTHTFKPWWQRLPCEVPPAQERHLEQFGAQYVDLTSFPQVLWNILSAVWSLIALSFKVRSGVRQVCILSPVLFAILIDWIMCQTTPCCSQGIQWILFSHLQITIDGVVQGHIDNFTFILGNINNSNNGAKEVVHLIWNSKVYSLKTKTRAWSIH